MNLLGLTCEQLIMQFQTRYGRGRYHAAGLYRAFYRRSELDLTCLPEFQAASGLTREVLRDLRLDRPVVVRQFSEEGVTKLVFGLHDGMEVETVVLPMANHTTVCISSQAGCRMGCRFCRTGRMGLRRNLSAAEIVAQVYTVKVAMGVDVRNVVFMGMGEPLDNFEAVTQAIKVLGDQRGLDIARRHITVSTVGLVEGIHRLAALNWPQLKLAVSLNAPDDATRTTLMPVNARYPMAALKQALRQFPLARGNALFMEYVLIKGINDQPGQANALADYLEGLPVKLNLIPCNPDPESPFAAPGAEAVDRFHAALIARNLFVRLRASKGARIRAACGQLGDALNR